MGGDHQSQKHLEDHAQNGAAEKDFQTVVSVGQEPKLTSHGSRLGQHGQGTDPSHTGNQYGQKGGVEVDHHAAVGKQRK